METHLIKKGQKRDSYGNYGNLFPPTIYILSKNVALVSSEKKNQNDKI